MLNSEREERTPLITSRVGQQHDITDPEKASSRPSTPLHSVGHGNKALLVVPINSMMWKGNGPITRIILFSPALLLLLYLSNMIVRVVVDLPSQGTHPQDSDYYDPGAPFAPYKTQRLWAAYSPYYSVEEYKPPPRDCRLTQVNILQRHGARYPTLGQTANIVLALLKLQGAESYTDEKLRFIADYQYDLRTDDLLPYGEQQAFESGRKSLIRYPTLANRHNLPFVRASGSDRVIKSAFKWIEGFRSSSGGTLQPHLSLIIPEVNGYNNTLEDKSCPKVDHPSAPLKIWQNIYAQSIADRLNTAARGMPENITNEDVHHLVALCALETVAKEEYSPFCDLFSDVDFQGFEYAIDLDKFYFTGHGSRLGPVQGVGYINELIARLTDMPVKDHTQTNHTLDSNPITFPLGRGIYVDFSHDNLMAAVISAIGLFKDNDPFVGGMLDPKRPPQSREWYTSRIVPFSGRMVVERMECGLEIERVGWKVGVSKMERHRQRRRENNEDTAFIRILMNDAVQDLEFCKDVDEDGLCFLRSFIESQVYARENGQGDWEMCFE